jgi:hypothetical protein
MADYSSKTTVEDAKLNPGESTGRGMNISITTWVMALVLLAIVAFGALMIVGFLRPGSTTNQTPAGNPSTSAKP